ncbi:MAG TPA: hypothetical protein PKA64_00440, partial [Myxococcota bacterium]|nr:hypothetical protein [Myxococcota bacterium]
VDDTDLPPVDDTDLPPVDGTDLPPVDDTAPVDSAGPPPADDTDAPRDTAAAPPWAHPEIRVDGPTAEWFDAERFTSASGTDAWVSWDAERLLIAVQHPDVLTGTDRHWLILTLGDGGPGTTTGTLVGTQQPGLPFEATHVYRYKLDGSYSDLATWAGDHWDTVPNPEGVVPGVIARELGASFELALPRGLLGFTRRVDLHLNLAYEGANDETSYAAVPAASFTDGAYDPDYGAWLSFRLQRPDEPRATAPSLPPEDTATPRPWSHTITVDGDPGDWTADERFATSAGSDVWVSWDADDVFFGVRHPDVGSGGPQHWIVLTLGDGRPGSRTGAAIGGQQPGLAFDATTILRVKADGSYNDRASWSGVGWDVFPNWLGADGSRYVDSNAASTVELSVPRATLGGADRLLVHVDLVFEGAGSESSYAVAPLGSFPEGAYDPDYTRWFDLDLASPAAPASYSSSP